MLYLRCTGFLLSLFLATDTLLIDPRAIINRVPRSQISYASLPIGKIALGDVDKSSILAICKDIQNDISGDSEVYYGNDLRYYEGISHYSATSTTLPVCSVEPGTIGDVAVIMKKIRATRVPFAVKGGGHTMNPGFSSTTGIHISMRRFCKTVYHSSNQTVDVGAGQTWDDVYRALEPSDVSVLGGRVAGVGVGGFALGGGYGWKSNQYGLAIDNIFEYQLVTPNGTLVYVNKESYPDIYFGLKGGFNNLGIVTNFNMRALPQTRVYGGILFYDLLQFDDVLVAVLKFQNNNKDPKAQLLCTFTSAAGVPNLNVIAFYDAPSAPENIFQSILEIPHAGVLKTRSYLSLVQAPPVSVTANMRGRFHTISVTNLTSRLLQKAKQLFLAYNVKLLTMAETLITIAIEPFLPQYFDFSQGGAYPHASSATPLLPINIQFGWQLPINNQFFVDEIQVLANSLLQTAVEDGQDVGSPKQIRYPNYALDTTPLADMYGENVVRLRTIRQSWEPDNVMNLTGGFKF